MSIVIDASVFVAAARPSEPHHADSRQFIAEVRWAEIEIVCPTLVLPECSAAIFRRTADAQLAAQIVEMTEDLPNLKLISLTLARAWRASNLAVICGLRGSDAIYIAVASEFSATMIAWDKEILRRGVTACPVMTPAGWLSTNP